MGEIWTISTLQNGGLLCDRIREVVKQPPQVPLVSRWSCCVWLDYTQSRIVAAQKCPSARYAILQVALL